MDYGAITLDTSIFDRNGNKLRHGLLEQLEQFKDMPVRLVLTEIVVRELMAHLAKKLLEVKQQVERALHESSEYLGVSPEKLDSIRQIAVPSADAKSLAKQQIAEFIERTGAQIIEANRYVKLEDLVGRYFNSKPPFSESGKKKSEFPDAIALLSLDAYAKKRGIKILAVSTDADWKSFADQSKHIDVYEDLGEALSVFQPQETAFALCRRIAVSIQNNDADGIGKHIEDYLADTIADIDPHIEADSQFYWELSQLEIELVHFTIDEDSEGKLILYPVQAQHNHVVVQAKLEVQVRATGDFVLSAHDSIDGDSVPIGSASKSATVSFETEILFTVSGDLEGPIGELDFDSFELLRSPRYIQFGVLEPDWWSEEPD